MNKSKIYVMALTEQEGLTYIESVFTPEILAQLEVHVLGPDAESLEGRNMPGVFYTPGYMDMIRRTVYPIIHELERIWAVMGGSERSDEMRSRLNFFARLMNPNQVILRNMAMRGYPLG